MAGLYFHIPFCKRVCAYCDFFREVGTARLPAVAEAMQREVAARRDFLQGAPVHTRYFGGGTPSLCPPAAIRALLDAAAAVFDCSEVAETTLEANPDDLTPDYLAALREAGIDRLSVGIQSFDDDCLRLMNRRHDARQAEAALRLAREAGFSNLSADLIFGVPGFGGEALQRSLDRLLAAGVPHISAYHLTVEPGTAFGRRAEKGTFLPVGEAVSEAEFLQVHDTLCAAGYEHYEVSNFALPGFRARHNSAYWDGTPYLGIGPGAHSYDGAVRCWNVASVTRYLAGASAECEVLTAADRFNEYLMTRLRTADGILLAEAAARFGAQRVAALLAAAGAAIEAGNLRCDGVRMAIPAARFLRSDAVIGELFEMEE